MSLTHAKDHAIKSFQSLGDIAATANTKLALEPNPAAYGTNFLNRVSDVGSLCDLIAHPAITLNFDIGALHMNDEIDNAVCLLYTSPSPRDRG